MPSPCLNLTEAQTQQATMVHFISRMGITPGSGNLQWTMDNETDGRASDAKCQPQALLQEPVPQQRAPTPEPTPYVGVLLARTSKPKEPLPMRGVSVGKELL